MTNRYSLVSTPTILTNDPTIDQNLYRFNFAAAATGPGFAIKSILVNWLSTTNEYTTLRLGIQTIQPDNLPEDNYTWSIGSSSPVAGITASTTTGYLAPGTSHVGDFIAYWSATVGDSIRGFDIGELGNIFVPPGYGLQVAAVASSPGNPDSGDSGQDFPWWRFAIDE